MTNVILIPCCKIKKSYGETTYEAGVSAPALLPPASGQALLDARRDLSRLLGLAPGPDLGSESQSAIEYMPAYERYDGHLYKEARLTSPIHRTGGSLHPCHGGRERGTHPAVKDTGFELRRLPEYSGAVLYER